MSHLQRAHVAIGRRVEELQRRARRRHRHTRRVRLQRQHAGGVHRRAHRRRALPTRAQHGRAHASHGRLDGHGSQIHHMHHVVLQRHRHGGGRGGGGGCRVQSQVQCNVRARPRASATASLTKRPSRVINTQMTRPTLTQGCVLRWSEAIKTGECHGWACGAFAANAAGCDDGLMGYFLAR